MIPIKYGEESPNIPRGTQLGRSRAHYTFTGLVPVRYDVSWVNYNNIVRGNRITGLETLLIMSKSYKLPGGGTKGIPGGPGKSPVPPQPPTPPTIPSIPPAQKQKPSIQKPRTPAKKTI